jgi:hypothetical protein
MFRVAMRVPLTGPWALLVGTVCIGLATYLFLTSSALLTQGIATDATVVGIDSRWGTDRAIYALVLEYQDQAGVSQRERTDYSWRHRWTRIGERAQIRYHPQRPSEFAIDSWYGLWMMPATFLVLGIAGCVGFLLRPSGG